MTPSADTAQMSPSDDTLTRAAREYRRAQGGYKTAALKKYQRVVADQLKAEIAA